MIKKLLITPLEERILLDAAIAHDAVAAAAHAEATPTHILVIPDTIQDSSSLISAAHPTTAIVTYDPATTNLSSLADKITAAAKGAPVESIGFVGVSDNGTFQLTAKDRVDGNSLNPASTSMIAFWQRVASSLIPGGGIDILSCGVAGTSEGQDVLSRLDSIINDSGSHLSIWASTDRTGSAALGGNWIMESGGANRDAGAIYFDSTALSAWNHALDSPDILVTPTSGLLTGEDGTTTSFSLVLAAAPIDDVTIGLSSSNTAEGTLSVSSVTFTVANWNTPQTVVVTGVNDQIVDGNIVYSLVTAPAVSLDPLYNGMDASDVSATNADDDTVGVNFSTSTITTSEAGASATVGVTLNSQPTDTVTLTFSTSNAAEGTVTSPTLVFTTANWNVAQNLTVAGVDDFVADGNIAYLIHSIATNNDVLYNGFVPLDISATNTDNDTVGVIVTPNAGLVTTEAGGTASFTVRLNSQPTADVIIALSSSDLTEGTLGVSSLIFTAANWNVDQTVTVTGVDDFVVDGAIAYSIITAPATSADTLYNGYDATDIAVTTTDNDTVGVIVTPTSGLVTTEAGGTATFTVRLNSQPTADVTIALSSSDLTEGTVGVSSLTFTAANWNVNQTVTVTGVNDFVVDGTVAYSIITAPATSVDALYNGFNASDVALTTTDNDTVGIIVTPVSGLITTEAGGTASFSITLNSQPTANVTIGITSNDLTEGTVSASSVVFTSLDWNVPHIVTITGVNDFIVDGNIAYSIVTAAATSTDTLYNGINAANVTVSNTDNDVIGLVYSVPSVTTTEAGGTAVVGVSLSSMPSGNVTLTFASSNSGEGTLSPTSLSFTAANWNVAQNLTVTGADDFIADGTVAYSIISNAFVSSDVQYNGFNPADLSAFNTDNDVVGIIVTPTSGLNTSEDGASSSFSIVLNSQPTADVTIGLSSSDLSEGTISLSSVTFTAANWNIPQTIVVTNVDDLVADGDVAYLILTAPAVSTDPLYNGLNAADVSLTNLDNDTMGVNFTMTSVTTTEAGGTATIGVTLNSQPTADVTLNLSSSNLAEGTLSTSTLTFTAANWNVVQNVVVTGVDDFFDDGNISYTIVTAPLVSADAVYNGFNPTNISASNTDNDTAGFLITPASGLSTTEAGGTASFTIALTSQPTADVTISLASSDTTEGTIVLSSLTFTAANWNVGQTVTATGINDFVVDGNITYNIATGAATSADLGYNGLDPANISLSNMDDDTLGINYTTNPITTTESGGAATVGVTLNSQPLANVSITFSSSNTGEGVVSPTTLVFTPADWNIPHNLVVTGVDDFAQDGNMSYTIQSNAGASLDPLYNGYNGADISATNLDNDSFGITVIPTSGLSTTEFGGPATFTIVLNSQPTANVTIGLVSNDTTEGTSTLGSVTFTPANWNIPKTITVLGVDDNILDGNVSYQIITGPAVSTDPLYNGYNAADVTLTNTDNDAAGVHFTSTMLSTSETGGTATVGVTLTSQPTDTVTLTFSSSDTSEGNLAPTTLVFTTANWNIAQNLVVTGVDDPIADGDIVYSIITNAATSLDSNYNGFNPVDLTATNVDNEVVGFTITPLSGLVTTEAGGTATFTVVLNSQPSADVTVGVTSSDITEGTVSTSSLVFTAANWNIAQTVTVTGVDDSMDDGDIPFTIILSPASSADPTFNGIVFSPISATNIDNDAVGVNFTTTSITTTENGGTATVGVSLNSQPTGIVLFVVSSSNNSEGMVSPTTLVFTPFNWNISQNIVVTGINDFSVDGNIAYNLVTAPLVSTDVQYSGFNPTDISATNTDNDVAGITVSPTTGLITSEYGAITNFTVVLTSQPTANVTIPLSSDLTEGTPSVSSLTFTPLNWNIPQTVTVTGVNDPIVDGNIVYSVVTGAAVSADPVYNGVNAADVTITNLDNDTAPGPGVNFSSTFVITTETGKTGTVGVTLNTQPTADVTLTFFSNDLTEGTLNPTTLTFTSANWNIAQNLTITGVDDSLSDGNITYSIISNAATSADASYNGLNPSDITVLNIDNEIVGVTVIPTSGLTTSEGGGTATYRVILNRQPTADVTFNVTSNDLTEGTTGVSSLTFNSSNYDTLQTVTVTGVDDALTDGNIAYTILHSAVTSADAAYNGFVVPNVGATNIDNDGYGVSFTTTSITTTEAGATATIGVTLTKQPSAFVQMTFLSSNSSEGYLSPNTLTFTSANWNVTQNIVVTGVNDFIDDGNIAYTIITNALVSPDGNYNGMNPTDISATNTDNDTAGVVITPTSGLVTTETGGTATFTVVLTSQPTADVTLGVSSSDPTEGTTNVNSVTFTAANWNIPQTVTISGIDDTNVDGDIPYVIVTAPLSSVDPLYNGLNSSDVNVTNTDNDTFGVMFSTTEVITNEAGTTATVTVTLNTQPLADVDLSFSSSNAAEGTVFPATLTFTAANWNIPQTLTITGVDDFVQDGSINYTILTHATVSADPAYNGIDPVDITGVNEDNDLVGIVVTPTGGLTTTEGGGASTFTIVLSSQPTATVTVGLTNSDTTEGSLSTSSVVFTAVNWNIPQTVTVTGLDDIISDGDIAYTIVTASAVSSDPLYNGINAADVSLTNLDNDTAGVQFTTTTITTTEAGGTASVGVSLTSQPTAIVILTFTSNDTSEGTLSPLVLVFTPANWNVVQTLTVTGVDDFIQDGSVSYTIESNPAVSADPLYNGYNPVDISASNLDNDLVGIIVTPVTGLNTTEVGGTSTFQIVLNSQPTADVVIGLSSNDTSEGVVSVSSLTFTNADWNIPKTVTVTGIDDFVVDGSIAYTIVTAAAVSTDPLYNGINPADVAVTNADNDSIGVNFTTTSITTTEAGGTATVGVTLNSQPTADVTMTFFSNNTAEGTVIPITLTFTAANWNVPQNIVVTGVDDFVDDGNINYSIITNALTSADPLYNGYNPTDISAVNLNNDFAGFTITPTSGLTTTEAGGTATFTVVLNSQPTADVTLPLSSSNLAEGTVGPNSLTFTAANWNLPQTVTVTGVNDFVVDGNSAYSVITGAATSADPKYNGLNPTNVSVINNDNDTVGVNYTTLSVTTTEAGGTAVVGVTLNSQPTANVTLTFSSNDTTEGIVGPTTLTFTPADWNIPHNLTITGVNDFVADGNIAYTILSNPASSTDLVYKNFNPADISAVNLDNDTPGITISPLSGLTTTEAGGTATFTIVLTSQPIANVTIGLSSDDLTEGTISASSVTFTPANWNLPKTLTVTGINDLVVDGNIPFNIITAPAVSTDPLYNGMNASDVNVTNNDNDVRGVNFTTTSITTTEAGGTATIGVTLNSQPTDNVTLTFTSSNTAEGTISPTTLTFTAANWNVAQNIVASGVNDFIDDGNIAYSIITNAATSADPIYNGFNPVDISASNTDNDTVGITVTPTSGLTTTEAGGTATFQVRLNSQPLANVTIGLTSNDLTEGTVGVSSLLFTAANWNVFQTVTVTGVDDFVVDGNQTYTIVTAPAVSTDALYNNRNATDVSLTNTDNDVRGVNFTTTSIVTTEAGGTAIVGVTLNSQPTANVTLTFTSNDTTEGTVSPTTLIFTAANWNVAQNITVTGVDDFVVDGNITYSIVSNAATSADAVYNGFNPTDITVVNTDDDTVGIIITPTSGLTTTEAGGAATFTIVLNSQPTANVTIGLTSNDTTEGTVGPSSVTFTAANWNIPRTVTVTGVDDFVVDGNIAYTIVTAAATSTDALYNGLNAADVTVTNTDNDSVGIIVTPVAGLTTTETGGSTTFTVVLNSQPTANVTIGVSSNDLTEGTTSVSSLTFTAANWNIAQTVTVTGVDDFVVDGNSGYTIVTAPAVSADGLYSGLDGADVSVTNLDNDVVGVNFTTTTITTTESGGTAIVGVTLNSQPTADVTLTFTSSDLTEGTLSPSTLTFTAANWNVAQNITVTGADDFVADGNIGYTIVTNAVTSADPLYNGYNPVDIAALNADNDTVGITVTPISGLTTTEAGGTATFQVVLNSQPTNAVTIGLSSSDLTEGTLSTNSLTFDASNWNIVQTVTITGVDDFVVDGTISYTIITAPGVSDDPLYNGLNGADVAVTNTDNDTVGVNYTTTSLTTTEAGGQATVGVTLNSQPTADVILTFISSNPDEGTVSPLFLTFTAANWNIAQTLTVTGTDDFLDDGDVSYQIFASAAISADPVYDGFNPADLNVVNIDNDTVGITVTPIAGLTTTEAGGTATFQIVLNSQPTDPVTIGLSSSDPAEGTLSTGSVTFDASNWNIAQTITVTGVDDFVVDGDFAYTIITAPATSLDVLYHGLNTDDVMVTNTDNDTIGIIVTPTSGLTTTEAGGTATFTVVLNSQPTADVVIGLLSSDPTEGTPSTNGLVFTAANWNIPQTVTVTGIDDFVVDGTVNYTILTASAASGDPLYNGYDVDNVQVSNTDNDVVGVNFTTLTVATTEAGGAGTMGVTLNSQPTADVTLTFTSNDLSEGVVGPTTLTFTAANWNIAQTLTVTGVDDFVQDGTITYTIVSNSATSADPIYNGYNPADITATNADDDTVGIIVAQTFPATTTEAGGTATFEITLNSQPTAPVTIALSSSDPTEGSLSVSSVTFDATNWNIPQMVTVTGVDDFVVDGNINYTIITAPAASLDPLYQSLDGADVTLTNNDNDTPGVNFTTTTITTTEGGSSAVVGVTLNSQPTSDVTLTFTTTDPTEGTVTTVTLVFTPTDWNQPHILSVTGVDDFVDDGNIDYTIVSNPATSADPIYNGFNPTDITAINVDDDTAEITVTPVGSLITTEAGGASSFTVVLNSQPLGDVTMGLSSSNLGEGVLSQSSVTFTSANWNIPQIITINGVDDFIIDGNTAYTIIFAPTTSTDANYQGLTPATLNVVNIDNDFPTPPQSQINYIAPFQPKDFGTYRLEPPVYISTDYLPIEPLFEPRDSIIFDHIDLVDFPQVMVYSAQQDIIGGEELVLFVKLSHEPKLPVDVKIILDEEWMENPSPSQLTFSPDDWNVPQKVVLHVKNIPNITAERVHIEFLPSNGKENVFQGAHANRINLDYHSKDSSLAEKPQALLMPDQGLELYIPQILFTEPAQEIPHPFAHIIDEYQLFGT